MQQLRVEAAGADGAEVVLVPLSVPPGTTAAEAVRLSGLPGRFPGLDTGPGRIGIFGALPQEDVVPGIEADWSLLTERRSKDR